MKRLSGLIMMCGLVSAGSNFSPSFTFMSKADRAQSPGQVRLSTLQVKIKIGYGGPELNGSSIMEGGFCTMTLSILKDGGVEQPEASYFNVEWAHDGGYDYGYPYYYQVPTVGPSGDETHQMNVMVTDTRDGSVGTYGAEYQVIGSERGTGFNCNL